MSWSRRRFLELAGAAVAGAVLPGGCAAEAPITGPRNIILITGDDLGWKDLSSSGNPNVRTPNLDRLARGGVSFRRAFDVTSTCSSSRTTYVTGQYPHTHGVVGLVHRLPELSLPAGTPTLASQLRALGMHTAIEGKWHVAFPATPHGYGYAEVMTTLVTQWILDETRTVDFIERNAERRFYFEVNYMNPHRDARGLFRPHPDHPVDPSALAIPSYVNLPDVPGAREELAAYYSQIERMDVMIGGLIQALANARLLDDTLIVFISDNGPPFPGNKLNLYDRGTGTPLLFHWPNGLPAGVVRDELVASVDLMPTLLDLVAATIPDRVQGHSLAPLLFEPAPAAGYDAVFSEMTQHKDTPFPMRSVRTDRYRYIRNYSDEPIPMEGGDQPWVMDVLAQGDPAYRWTARRVPEQLFDVSADPNEQVNLVEAPAAQAVLAELRARLDMHMAATEDPFLGRPFATGQP